MQHLPRFIPIRPTSSRVTKDQLAEALRRTEMRLSTLAAENDRLRHALEIERANNHFQIGRAA
jgi:hypothetical protein